MQFPFNFENVRLLDSFFFSLFLFFFEILEKGEKGKRVIALFFRVNFYNLVNRARNESVSVRRYVSDGGE